mgnify:CR=1 FL=1
MEFLEDIDGVGAEVLEPQRIAKIICELMKSGFTVTENGQERPIEYRDFCILLRSSNKYAPVYAENLRNAGIPTWRLSRVAFRRGGGLAHLGIFKTSSITRIKTFRCSPF